MEITNCEQYVLAELDYEHRRNERLEVENNRLVKRLDAMTKRAQSYYETIHREKTPIEVLADKIMREKMLDTYTYAPVTSARFCPGGQILDFEEWCHEAVYLKPLPSGIDEGTLVDFLRPDLKDIYDRKVREEQGCTE